MRTLWTTAVMLAVVTVGTTSGLAQVPGDPERPPLPAQAVPLAEHAIHAPSLSVDNDSRQAELERWMSEFSEWKKWRESGGAIAVSPARSADSGHAGSGPIPLPG